MVGYDVAVSAVAQFNERVEEAIGNARNFSAGHCMSLETNGTSTIITFMGVVLWDSEDDEREFIEERGDYEPLADFLRREAKKVLKQFYVVLYPDEEQP